MLRVILSTWVMLFLIAGSPTGWQPFASAEENAKNKHEVYEPKDLEDCFTELNKILKPKDIEKIERGTEHDMVKYHMGLGMWMRNNWGLWKGGRLAKWFNDKGIHHPDDMSGIILDSYWRHLNAKPIELDKQVKHYQDYWAQVRIDDEREKARAKRAVAEVRGMMMGISLAKTSIPAVTLPMRQGGGLRARFLARFGNNVLIAVRTGPVENFTTPGYYLDLEEKKIHPVRIPEIEYQQYAVVAGGAAYFSGVTKGAAVLVAVNGKTRTLIPLPETKCVPQLGVDGGNLLAVCRNSVYTLQGMRWSAVYKGDIKLPKSGPPPQKFGDKIFFRDEGRGESDKRLWWLELTDQPRLVSLDKDIGAVGPTGPRWEDSYSFSVTPGGDLWATVGSDLSGESLIKRSAAGKYEIAIINNSLQFDGKLLSSRNDSDGLSVSAVSTGTKGAVLLAGDRGIYTLSGKRLQQVVAFLNVRSGPVQPNSPWQGCPGDILQLGADSYLISGVFGGIYLIERTAANEFNVVDLDETIGKPVVF